MRFRFGSSAALMGAVLLVGGLAEAQPKPPPPPGADRSNSQFTLRREEAGGAEAQTARARARAGDCAGALPAFDAAIRGSIDPTLRRDRGLCHEKLGDPFPAVDDYRAYLAARPDAPDADDIRQRLANVEAASGQSGGAPPRAGASSGEGAGARDEAREASASLTVGSRGVYSSASSSESKPAEVIGPKPGEKAHPYDYYVEQEKISDAARKSPLRYGSGLILGPFVNVPRIFLGNGATSDIGYAAGATLRYSTGRVLTLMSEVGYTGIGKGGESTSRSGLLLMGGLEARLALSRLASDHLLFRAGVGYERYVVEGTRQVIDNLAGRFAFGYRHVFGTAVGLEALADGGPLVVFPENSGSRVNGLIGLSVALVVGF